MLTADGEGRHLGNTPFLDFPDVMEFLLFSFICSQLLSILLPSYLERFLNPGRGAPHL